MAGDSVITEEMKKLIGVETDPTIVLVEKEPIRRFADAIGDPNPLYHDEEYVRKLGYRSIIAPPAMSVEYGFVIKRGTEGIRFRPPFSRNLNGGNEFEFLQPIQAGDTISITNKIADLYEREGRLGKMLFIIRETTYRNQKNEVVMKIRHTGISY